ncbi:MAG: hypothetical protein RTU63_01325 [Candidatus Thorarchaeota archaeon]
MPSLVVRDFNDVIESIGSHTQFLLVTESDDDFNSFLDDFNKSLISAKQMDENQSDLPYQVVRFSSDGDMLDDMYRLAASDGNFDPTTLHASTLNSKQAIFQGLYQTITKNKFIVFHITEHPILDFFEDSMKHFSILKENRTLSKKESLEIIQLPDFLQLPHIVDDIIIQYLQDLREHGSESHRMKYANFYRTTASLLMEMSNVFLAVPTVGMNRHLVVSSWRTQTLLLGFSPLTWSSGSFNVIDLSGRDIDARWTYPVDPSDDSRTKQYLDR